MSCISHCGSEISEERCLISSDDGSVSFVVRGNGRTAYVERVQPLVGIGRLSHIMRFQNMAAFDKAYETDNMRFKYPLVYWRLRRAVGQVLEA